MMFNGAWLITALLLFMSGLRFIEAGNLAGMLVGIVLFLLCLLCLLGFQWSFSRFQRPEKILPSGEEIHHGK